MADWFVIDYLAPVAQLDRAPAYEAGSVSSNKAEFTHFNGGISGTIWANIGSNCLRASTCSEVSLADRYEKMLVYHKRGLLMSVQKMIVLQVNLSEDESKIQQHYESLVTSPHAILHHEHPPRDLPPYGPLRRLASKLRHVGLGQ
ncbi:uncharacterized protein METZ01_LOCUS392065 [marine metagenome]|uniref:Uncharacterized protein n=1 Tax=marine metagenome TaxID=408172 RepID=A0A382UZW7_9ZZZZ